MFNKFEKALNLLVKSALHPFGSDEYEKPKEEACHLLRNLLDCQLTPEEIDFLLWDDDEEMSEGEQKKIASSILSKLRRQKGVDEVMYISEFWCGVIAANVVEIGLLVCYGIHCSRRKN